MQWLVEFGNVMTIVALNRECSLVEYFGSGKKLFSRARPGLFSLVFHNSQVPLSKEPIYFAGLARHGGGYRNLILDLDPPFQDHI